MSRLELEERIERKLRVTRENMGEREEQKARLKKDLTLESSSPKRRSSLSHFHKNGTIPQDYVSDTLGSSFNRLRLSFEMEVLGPDLW